MCVCVGCVCVGGGGGGKLASYLWTDVGFSDKAITIVYDILQHDQVPYEEYAKYFFERIFYGPTAAIFVQIQIQSYLGQT